MLLLVAFVLGLVGVGIGAVLSYLAASNWESFDQFFLLAGCVAPIITIGMGAWPLTGLLTKADQRGRHVLLLVLIATAFGTLGSYLCFVIVSTTWHHESILAGLLDPSRVAPIGSGKPGRMSETSVYLHTGLGAVVSPIVTFLTLRRQKNEG